MTIRIVLRAIPLLCVMLFALGVLVNNAPGDRARDMARAQSQRLAWAVGLVKCPDPMGNLPLSACMAGNSPRNPPPPH